MSKLIKTISFVILLIIITVVGLFVTAIEDQPLIEANSGEQVNQAESVKKLMQQLSDSVKNRNNKQNINVSQDQLNSLVGFAQRAHGKINGRVFINSNSTIILASYQLPKNPVGEYLNIDILLLPGPGINVSHVKFGPINVPGSLALDSLVYLANWYTNSNIASQFVKQVESVAMTEQQIQLSVLPLDQFLRELNDVKQGVGGSSDEEMRLRTAYYLKQLSLLDVGDKPSPQSLAKYIGPVFSWAKNRSNYDTAPKENEAAILALAIYAGHHRFANLIGDVQPQKGKVALPRVRPTLKSRADLNQHFIFSAAIKILSEQGLSIAIGEFKELMDRSDDGSGYSFVDLAADFAGVEFAIAATNPSGASSVQNILAGISDENAFFPNITGLPEGLSKTDFTRIFTKVDSPEYLEMVQSIKQRIAVLPIHR
ncbi:hypothetical protein [Paraglaciecola psychrophila]|uniref:Uncharacterized protein n=1 Tax=Paraglaciecola psychrophila 170 TaxID=1129794 RepID=K6ZJ75_9ALTE|nr:hypothetical protein [Paraglaciecola psychrophila]AGH42593.1 hypothetical protein C427_0483 [Paraglaciecola psychrophila 170]GAC36051.1 hypothetical protein GPSY_0409 [Paraglaciecola psychrophila 170]